MGIALKQKLNKIKRPIFEHLDLNIPKIERVTLDGNRYYKVPDVEDYKTFNKVINKFLNNSSIKNNTQKYRTTQQRKKQSRRL
jgi:hypothetical protein